MATTYLQLVNNVLARLREDSVSSVSDTTYSRLIGILANDAKREIEDAHDWNCLAQTIVVSTVAGTSDYTLTGSGQRFKVKDAINDTHDSGLEYVAGSFINRQKYIGVSSTGAPWYYTYNGVTGNDTNISVWPVPDDIYSLRFDMILPQEDLTLDADILTVPAHLVQMLTHAKAVAERGEDSGQSFAELYQQYRLALADAVSLDRNRIEEDVVWEEV